MLDYDYFKNHCRLIVIDLSRGKELEANPKQIQEIEFVQQFMFVLTVLEKIREAQLEISQRIVRVLEASYKEAN